ncbi:PREDICTED: uncharacterized protein LOC106807390 [Priapulus caudatus]|uniref:Uncharacterized protein LOC106807390 n=1 Tax=Priapulus caudatus TaxID=37621 RepID=A0ABM1DZ22_PRICU|nr:PREDICTED: uncharacterized protein LOC106807390 [Priapulus caudatus]XP_014665193.1 PREDICTED: uncharacterized protein LOC106807390 [Priapulus caudatus]
MMKLVCILAGLTAVYASSDYGQQGAWQAHPRGRAFGDQYPSRKPAYYDPYATESPSAPYSQQSHDAYRKPYQPSGARANYDSPSQYSYRAEPGSVDQQTYGENGYNVDPYAYEPKQKSRSYVPQGELYNPYRKPSGGYETQQQAGYGSQQSQQYEQQPQQPPSYDELPREDTEYGYQTQPQQHGGYRSGANPFPRFENDKYGNKIENQVNDIQVQCDTNNRYMQVTLKFNKYFNGRVYTRGFFEAEKCQVYGSGHDVVEFHFPIDGCGTEEIQEDGYGVKGSTRFQNVIVVMMTKDLAILEAWDRAYKVSCLFEAPEPKQMSAGINLPTLSATPVPEQQIRVPDVRIKVVEGKDIMAPSSNGLVVGDYGTLVVLLDDNSNYDIFVSSCVAHDGYGKYEVLLIDDSGCAIVPKIIEQLQKVRIGHSQEQTVMFAHFHAFKFPDKQNVYFTCNVQLCQTECYMPQCGAGDQYSEEAAGHRRLKRGTPASTDNVTIADSKQLYRNIAVFIPGDNNADSLPWQSYIRQRQNGSELGFCLSRGSFTAGIVIMAAIFLFTVVVTSVMIARARRRKETTPQ